MRVVPRVKIVAAVMTCMLLLLGGCKRDTVVFDLDVAAVNREALLNAFGPTAAISGAELVEDYYQEKDSELPDFQRPYSYLRWNIRYTNGYGKPAMFEFHNNNTPFGAPELSRQVGDYLNRLVQTYYRVNFFVPHLAPYIEDSSGLFCYFYHLFSDPKKPKTNIMFDQRIQYRMDILKHAHFDALRYDTVFAEYPVVLNMYCDVQYTATDPTARQQQEQVVEAAARSMLEEMIRFSDGTLNATISFNYFSKKGFEKHTFFIVLRGQYYEGEDYELDLHEAFFGEIALPD